tara:strand:+ start:17746 stop:18075 length:330 start_codon:yes stop_codon:yes gene_type:complete
MNITKEELNKIIIEEANAVMLENDPDMAILRGVATFMRNLGIKPDRDREMFDAATEALRQVHEKFGKDVVASPMGVDRYSGGGRSPLHEAVESAIRNSPQFQQLFARKK